MEKTEEEILYDRLQYCEGEIMKINARLERIETYIMGLTQLGITLQERRAKHA